MNSFRMKKNSQTKSNLYCKACGSNIKKSNPERCYKCGFLFYNNYREEFDYNKGYDEDSDYNKLKPYQILDHYKKSPNIIWALKHLKVIRNKITSPRLLEIGPSQGAFMKLSSQLGYSVKGIELSSSSIEYAKNNFNFGGNLELGECRRKQDKENCVDVVCAFEVLEHSQDPIEFMENIKTWIGTKGFAFLSVPNSRRLSVRIGRREIQDFPPHHLMYFNKDSLSSLMERVGFEVLEVNISPLTHSDILSAVFPTIAKKRASSLGSFQPVGIKKNNKNKSRINIVKFYPMLIIFGKLISKVIDKVFPQLGSRLMIMVKLKNNI